MDALHDRSSSLLIVIRPLMPMKADGFMVQSIEHGMVPLESIGIIVQDLKCKQSAQVHS